MLKFVDMLAATALCLLRAYACACCVPTPVLVACLRLCLLRAYACACCVPTPVLVACLGLPDLR